MNMRQGLLILAVALSPIFLSGCGDKEPKSELPKFDAANLQQGRSTWMQVCRNCHLMGVAGAPALADYEAWEHRLGKGVPALYQSAIRGIRSGEGWSMPPRGGSDSLSDTDVRLAVDYTIAAVEALKRD